MPDITNALKEAVEYNTDNSYENERSVIYMLMEDYGITKSDFINLEPSEFKELLRQKKLEKLLQYEIYPENIDDNGNPIDWIKSDISDKLDQY